MAQKKQFTLEDLNYGGTNYHNLIPENRYTAWWGDELVRTEYDHCSLVDKQTGEETLLFHLVELNEWAGTVDSTRIRHFYYATFPYPGEPLVLLSSKQERMLVDWQQKRCVWRQSRQVNGLHENNEDWNSTSRAVAFVSDHNLYVTDGDGRLHQVSRDGSRELVYGQSVHRDEFGIEKGTFWSGDGRRLAFYRMDQSMVADYPQVDIEPRIASYEPDKYPMAGETSHKVTVGIFDLSNDRVVYLDAGDPTDRYFTNIQWSPDGNTIYMFELNRDQNDCRLTSYDAVTGKKKGELYRETSDKYVEPLHPITFLPWDSNKFILQSQRDGHNHLYLYNTDGKLLKQLTKGDWVVMELSGFNEKKKSVIILSNETNPIQANFYEVSIANGKLTLLDNGQGYHHGELSKSGLYLCDISSAPSTPRDIDIIDLSGNKSQRYNWLHAADPWKDYEVPTYESGTIKAADGTTDLFYRLVKPIHFDPTKKYPTIIYVYGGPHAHCVDASWHYSSRSWETYMAQKGYVLFILDNRGSENRGRDFEQVTFRHLGQEEMADQMKGVEFLRSLPFVDSDRMGVHGWSFGGFMTITLMVNHPEVFKVGVAGGPVIDWKWYEVMYGERYMDTPQTNAEGYEQTSLISRAKDLKGKLQIITGYNDATVVPQHCLSFIAACIQAGTQPDFFVYPGEPHNMRGHQSTHLHERISQYFDDYLK
ncbi:MAG: DPP IV N-terminal domain-containing protein [Prevotella sp.]|nr:DPP IV N-terminal domain-containing protein [Prevotella sp.]